MNSHRGEFVIISPPVGVQNIAISVSVCLSVHSHIKGPTSHIYYRYLQHLAIYNKISTLMLSNTADRHEYYMVIPPTSAFVPGL